MLSELAENEINRFLRKILIDNFDAKYFYLSLLKEYKTFLPIKKNKKTLAIEFFDDCTDKSLKKVQRIFKILKSANLLKVIKQKTNCSIFQLIPPQPYRLLKGEFIQSRIKSVRQSTHREIILTKIRDIHDYDFTQDYHFIDHSTEDAVLNNALDGMERGFDLFFVAEVKLSKQSGYWLDHSTHFTNDWLIREHEQALEAVELESLKEEETELGVTPPPIAQVESPRFGSRLFRKFTTGELLA